MITVLVVGQTPPPFHGQAIMIAEMLRLDDPGLRLVHVRMDFSAEIHEIGRLKPGKILRLAGVIWGIWRAKLMHRPDVLYYPPSGPKSIAVYRDIAILLATRWLFRKTVFHFHAGGLSELYPALPALLKPFFRLAYGSPDLSIRLSSLNPEDGKALGAKREVVVPYGIPDMNPEGRMPSAPGEGKPVGILFVGIVCESKGITCLLDACGLLAAQGRNFRAEIMGRFESGEFERETRDRVARLGLDGKVSFLGSLSGTAKSQAFARAGIFCFPSFYESETFGVVLLEAMCFGLPAVTTRWRGIPSVVSDGENGFLTAIRDPAATAECLSRLIADPALRARMGSAGRSRFERDFRLDAFHRAMAGLFLSV